jgi:hypothetical protein
LTPSRILHIAAFVTLCKAYMGIENHFDLWNYFFWARLRPGPDVEAAVWGSVDISVRSRSRVDPYFHSLMSDPLVRWRKEWFFSKERRRRTASRVHGYPPCLSTQLGVWCGPVTHPQATTTVRHHLGAPMRRVDGRGPTDLRLPSRSVAPAMGGDNVDVSRAKLTRSFLLR